MTRDKTDPQAQSEITEAGAVELEENALDDASGGLLPASLATTSLKIAPTSLKIGERLDAYNLDVNKLS